MSDKINASFFVEHLNDFLAIDSIAMQKLVDNRVSVSGKLALEDVDFVCSAKGDGFEIGLIGIINGMVQNGRVAVIYDNGVIKEFTVLP